VEPIPCPRVRGSGIGRAAAVRLPVRTWLRSIAGPSSQGRRQAIPASTPAQPVVEAQARVGASATATSAATEPSTDLRAFLRFTVEDLWYAETDLDRAMDLLAVCELEPAADSERDPTAV
jgi:hypothetical protein